MASFSTLKLKTNTWISISPWTPAHPEPNKDGEKYSIVLTRKTQNIVGHRFDEVLIANKEESFDMRTIAFKMEFEDALPLEVVRGKFIKFRHFRKELSNVFAGTAIMVGENVVVLDAGAKMWQIVVIGEQYLYS